MTTTPTTLKTCRHCGAEIAETSAGSWSSGLGTPWPSATCAYPVLRHRPAEQAPEPTTPTWGEAAAGWNPDVDGQGNEGLAAAADRIEVERARSASTFGKDYRGTACEGVIIRTLGPDGAQLDQAQEVTTGYRNYAEAMDRVNELRQADHKAGGRSWWLAFQAGSAAEHLGWFDFPVPAQLEELAATPAS